MASSPVLSPAPSRPDRMRPTPTSPPRALPARGTAPMSRGPTARAAVASPVKPRPKLSTAASRAGVEPTLTQDETEKLLIKVQDKDAAISGLTTENDGLSSALKEAESRLSELYADQSRGEEELAARIEVADKLRQQVRELEREKQVILKRYNEQTSTFDAERQAFYDNEQHLKSRIQTLSQARKRTELSTSYAEPDSEAEQDDQSIAGDDESVHYLRQDLDDPEDEPAEMTSLKLELSTLSTSYTSMQSTLLLLQTQLVDLKRVNHELQEENESYMILMTEKTLSGQFDLMKQVGTANSEDDDGESVLSLRSTTRSSMLDPVEEAEESLEDELERSLQSRDTDSPQPRHGNRPGRKHGSHSPSTRGESLADLPVAGPGLDLAAELGRAENKDILEGNVVEDRDASVLNGKAGKRGKKSSERRSSDAAIGGTLPIGSVNDLDALRTEVKSLKDANKALSLYASKILDRILLQDGFEHVLAVDYQKPPPTPSTPFGVSTFAHNNGQKPRPASVQVGRSMSQPGPETPTMANRMAASASASPALSSTVARDKAQRRSLSFDWTSFSMFGGDKKKTEATLRPLTLKPGASGMTGRKLETHEDEDDRRERDRLAATMKLMGIEQPATPPTDLITSFPISKEYVSPSIPPVPETPSRFSFFRRNTVSMDSPPSFPLPEQKPANLTHEALETVEAEQSLAALDLHERQLSSEMAKGTSPTMFTEISPRSRVEGGRSRRSRKSGGSGSGSTVWSANMPDDD